MCSTSENLRQLAEWEGKGTAARQRLIEKLQGMCASKVAVFVTSHSILGLSGLCCKPVRLIKCFAYVLKILAQLSTPVLLYSIYAILYLGYKFMFVKNKDTLD